jgi:hypothetical protein
MHSAIEGFQYNISTAVWQESFNCSLLRPYHFPSGKWHVSAGSGAEWAIRDTWIDTAIDNSSIHRGGVGILFTLLEQRL